MKHGLIRIIFSLDWNGVGNESPKIRREHINAFLTLYERPVIKSTENV